MSHSIRRTLRARQPTSRLATATPLSLAAMREVVSALSSAARGKLTTALLIATLLIASTMVFAQDAASPGAPVRETPRPQDLDPAVNTSALPTDPAPSSTNADTAKSSSSARPSASGEAGSAPSGAPRPQSSPAAAAAPAAGASSPTRSTAPGSASPSAAPSTPNQSSPPAAAAGAKPKSRSSDRLELDTTQITGNRELPKVLYIVPWKRADLGDLVGKPVNSLLDEVLAPVDRDVFKRENRYYRALTPTEGQPANGAAAPSASPTDATSSGSATPAARDER